MTVLVAPKALADLKVRELGRHAVEDYTQTKTFNMHIGGRTGWWMPQQPK